MDRTLRYLFLAVLLLGFQPCEAQQDPQAAGATKSSRLQDQDLKTVVFEVDPPGAEVWVEAVVEGSKGNFLGKAGEPIILSKKDQFGKNGLATFFFEAEGYEKGSLPSVAWSRFSDGKSFSTGVSLSLKKSAGMWMRIQNLRRQGAWVDGLFVAMVLLAAGIVGVVGYQRKFSKKARLAQEKKKIAEDRGLNERFGEYYIKSVIATGGGGGVVHRAVPIKDPIPENDVALKKLNASFAHDYHLQEQFNREIRSTKNFPHPNIIKVYDFGKVEGQLFFTMELLQGVDVHTLLRNSKGGLKPKLAGHIILQAAEGLHQAHRQGVIHRDVKGENLFVRKKNQSVVVIDFGCARRPIETIQLTLKSKDGKAPGTMFYMPPESKKIETVEDEERYITQAYDQFSLAALAFELLTQRRPFYCVPEREREALMMESLMFDSIHSVTKYREDLSTDFDPIFEKALAREPEDRYDSILEFAKEFDRVCKMQKGRATAAK